jgi:predicted ATPase/class 3 adenylate cyclase
LLKLVNQACFCDKGYGGVIVVDDVASPLPMGEVTFLFTDIQGSTPLWESEPDAMRESLATHNRILHTAVTGYGGHVYKIIGDAFQAAFATPIQALNAALAGQRELAAAKWNRTGPLLVRMGLHLGPAEASGTDYAASHTLNRVARIMSAAHGGQVLLSEAVAQEVRDSLPEQVTLRDMGRQRMKGMTQLEHLFQVVAPDLPADFPRLNTLDITPNNLPLQLTTFIGREKEIATVKRLLARARLVTLSGSGGSGKTRLAIEVAGEVQADFPHGVWLVELASLADPLLITQAVASALGVREEENRPLLATVIDFLRERTLLLLLDNCEHLIEACASLAESLLHTCPKVRLLASSREALGINGEITFPVPSLSTPDMRSLPPLESLAQYEAVRLFVERAALALPGFILTADNAATVVEVCHRLDGIPLAIELAAARVRLLSVEQIAARLNDRFRLLTVGSRTALPRQQTLRALIDWSYDLLTEVERTLLRRLSVFAGGWSLTAAEAVAAEAVVAEAAVAEAVVADGEQGTIAVGDVLDLLAQLVNKSLVIAKREQGTETRYHLLETIRQYASEKLWAAEEGEMMRHRHLDTFMRLAEEAEEEVTGPDQVAWLNRLEEELDNLRAAVEWAQKNNPVAGIRMIGALRRFFLVQGHLNEGIAWLSQLMDQPQAIPRTPLRVKALAAAANLTVWRGDFIRSRALAEECLEIARELGDGEAEALAHHLLGSIGDLTGEHASGWSHLMQALALYRQMKNRQAIAELLVDAGSLSGDVAQRRTYLEEGLALGREQGDLFSIARALDYLGVLAMWQGKFEQARAKFEESIAIHRLFGTALPIDALQRLGVLALREGNYGQARRYLEEALSLSQNTGQQSSGAWAIAHLGYIALQQGDVAQARTRFTQAQHLFAKGGLKIGVVYALEGFATLAVQQGRPERAARLFAWADATRDAIHNTRRPVEQLEVDHELNAIRSQIDEAMVETAWAEGRAMTMEQAIAFALEHTGQNDT